MMRRLLRTLLLVAALAGGSVHAGDAKNAQTLLHLLDYIGVDYPEAVQDGRIRNPDEYKEMLEFTAQVSERLKALPDAPQKAQLAADAAALAGLVTDKAAPPAVADASGKLRWAIVEAYQLRLAPRLPPDPARGKALYVQHCASCHGATGLGDGPAAKGVEPPPSNFHDLPRMAQRSAYGLYNTITLGVEGTSMPSFRQLSEAERWSLAFYVGSVGIPAERIAQGQRLWESGMAKGVIGDLGPVATLSTDEMAQRHGEQAARVQDYLRTAPAALRPAPLAFARQKISEAAQVYGEGDPLAARDAAIKGYLEGFELAEAPLANFDGALMLDIERRMLGLRAAIEAQAPAQSVKEQAATIDQLLATAEEKLGGEGLSSATAFTASLVILLREGLEAILVLAAIIAFVVKTGRRDALPWVHAGWISALLLGALTWVMATFLVDISGANRELTEGVTALLAAAMLLYVGWWLHGKSYAEAWTRFIREQVGAALGRRTLWAMAAVSFLAVYREMFEVVLFYQALWAQAGEARRGPVLGGMLAAALALAVIGFLLFKYSVRLPIGPFFGATSALLGLLAVVFTGHGVAALQEAGFVGVSALDFDPVGLLGIYPTLQTLGAQALVVAILAGGYWTARRSALRTRMA